MYELDQVAKGLAGQRTNWGWNEVKAIGGACLLGFAGDVGGELAVEGSGVALGAEAEAIEGLGPDVVEAEETVTNTTQTFYRGDAAGMTEFQSHAAQAGGQEYSQQLIDQGDPDELMQNHAINSSNPPSPFISVTTDPQMAAYFAGENGAVYQLDLAPGRAIQNPYGLSGENEWLVPNYISPTEIVGIIE